MSDIESSPEISDAFTAPEANLANVSEEKPVLELERFSAWGVLGLSIITMGIYYLYWLYSRGNKVNSLTTTAKVKIGMLVVYIVWTLISNVIQYVFPPEDPTFLIGFGIVTIAMIIPYVLAVFSFRKALEEIINAGTSETVALGGVLTFFFSAIYFQYKINEAIDNQNQ